MLNTRFFSIEITEVLDWFISSDGVFGTTTLSTLYSLAAKS